MEAYIILGITNVASIVALVVLIIITSKERLEIIKLSKAVSVQEVLQLKEDDKKEMVKIDDGRYVSMEDMPLSIEEKE